MRESNHDPAQQLLAMAAVSVVACSLAWLAAEPSTARANPPVQVSADPKSAVLVVTTRGGMTNWYRRVELFGDGRVAGKHGFASDPPQPVFDDQMPREELVALITDLADSNALEGEWELLPAVRAKRQVTDAGSTYLDVRLTRYRERMVKPNRSIHFRLGGYALSNAVRELPEVPELAAIGRILSRLDELAEEHQQSRRD